MARTKIVVMRLLVFGRYAVGSCGGLPLRLCQRASRGNISIFSQERERLRELLYDFKFYEQ